MTLYVSKLYNVLTENLEQISYTQEERRVLWLYGGNCVPSLLSGQSTNRDCDMFSCACKRCMQQLAVSTPVKDGEQFCQV